MKQLFHKLSHRRGICPCGEKKNIQISPLLVALLACVFLLLSCTPEVPEGAGDPTDRLTQASTSSNEATVSPGGSSTGAGEIELPLDPF